MVILKIEGAAAVDAAAAVALEDGPPDLAGDGLTLVTRALLPAFLDVQQGYGRGPGAWRRAADGRG